MSPRTLCTLAAAGALIAGLAATPTRAWAPASQVAIARDAARFAPPPLAALLTRHGEALDGGAVEPFTDADWRRHVKNDDGSGTLDQSALAELDGAIAALRARRPADEIARRFGRLSHWAADLNNPLNASARDRSEARYFRDYFLYADAVRPRFAVVFYRAGDPRRRVEVAALERAALERGRRFYPSIGDEYRRIGFANGLLSFDDKSTAFAVAALAYSHAVSDAAHLFRYAWVAASSKE
jgi:hypothetical protein